MQLRKLQPSFEVEDNTITRNSIEPTVQSSTR